MKYYTNQTGISLSLAVWLAHDTYDHHPDPNAISATTLLQPLRAIVLARQNKDLDQTGDIVSLVASSSGTAYHNDIRQAWLSKKLRKTLESLNYPASVIERIIINPKDGVEYPGKDIIIYTEIRTEKAVANFIVSGELDFCMEGNLEDHKSTSVYAWIFGSNDWQYKMQGSIYKWLNPTKVTGDKVQINYIFTDWSGAKARQDKDYPQKRIMSKAYQLLTIAETDMWVKDRLKNIEQLMGASQANLPLCNKEELWQSDSVWKYYKDPTKKARSTKNFDDSAAAFKRLADDGNVGEVVEVPGKAKKCEYCKVADICDQATDLVASGLLIR